MYACVGGGGGEGSDECRLNPPPPPLRLSMVLEHKEGELMLGCVCVCVKGGGGGERGECGLASSVFLWSLDTNRSVNAGVCMCNGRGVVWTRPLSLSIVLGHKQGELMLGCVCLGGGGRE